MNKLIDMHIHLTNEKYEDEKSIISESKSNNIIKMLVIGCDKKEIIDSLELVKKYKDYLYLSIGFHPIYISKIKDEDIIWLKKLIKENPQIVAIGEIGLDYYWYPEQKEEQKKWFKKQIRLAKELNKPMIIHSRESYDDCYNILKEEDYFKGIMHSFADDYQSAKRFIDKGMYISISGPVTFKNGFNQKDVVKNIDLSKLLIETDGPYLTPAPFRGQLNKPIYLKYIIEEISKIREISQEELSKQILKNVYKIIGEME